MIQTIFSNEFTDKNVPDSYIICAINIDEIPTFNDYVIHELAQQVRNHRNITFYVYFFKYDMYLQRATFNETETSIYKYKEKFNRNNCVSRTLLSNKVSVIFEDNDNNNNGRKIITKNYTYESTPGSFIRFYTFYKTYGKDAIEFDKTCEDLNNCEDMFSEFWTVYDEIIELKEKEIINKEKRDAEWERQRQEQNKPWFKKLLKLNDEIDSFYI